MRGCQNLRPQLLALHSKQLPLLLLKRAALSAAHCPLQRPQKVSQKEARRDRQGMTASRLAAAECLAQKAEATRRCRPPNTASHHKTTKAPPQRLLLSRRLAVPTTMPKQSRHYLQCRHCRCCCWAHAPRTRSRSRHHRVPILLSLRCRAPRQLCGQNPARVAPLRRKQPTHRAPPPYPQTANTERCKSHCHCLPQRLH